MVLPEESRYGRVSSEIVTPTSNPLFEAGTLSGGTSRRRLYFSKTYGAISLPVPLVRTFSVLDLLGVFLFLVVPVCYGTYTQLNSSKKSRNGGKRVTRGLSTATAKVVTHDT